MYTDAACRDSDPELFFPERARGFISAAYRAQYAEAQAVCAGCPSRLRCLEDNLDVPDGIWGGLDRHDRGQLIAAEGRVNGKGRPQFRNMSPFPNEHQVLAQRARQAALAEGNMKKIHDAEYATRRREAERDTLARSA